MRRVVLAAMHARLHCRVGGWARARARHLQLGAVINQPATPILILTPSNLIPTLPTPSWCQGKREPANAAQPGATYAAHYSAAFQAAQATAPQNVNVDTQALMQRLGMLQACHLQTRIAMRWEC